MGTMAILRNIRFMIDAGIPPKLIQSELLKGRSVLPFEYFRAYQAVPLAKSLIENVMLQHLTVDQKLPGVTIVFVDVSASMDQALSTNNKKSNSDILPTSLMDAACMFAILLREWCETGTTVSFAENARFIPGNRGFQLLEDIKKSQPHGCTMLGKAITDSLYFTKEVKIDRIIVITDEQSHDNIPNINIDKKYFISLGNYKNQLKTDGSWVHVTGFSENVIQYIMELERPSFFSNSPDFFAKKA